MTVNSAMKIVTVKASIDKVHECIRVFFIQDDVWSFMAGCGITGAHLVCQTGRNTKKLCIPYIWKPNMWNSLYMCVHKLEFKALFVWLSWMENKEKQRNNKAGYLYLDHEFIPSSVQ